MRATVAFDVGAIEGLWVTHYDIILTKIAQLA